MRAGKQQVKQEQVNNRKNSATATVVSPSEHIHVNSMATVTVLCADMFTRVTNKKQIRLMTVSPCQRRRQITRCLRFHHHLSVSSTFVSHRPCFTPIYISWNRRVNRVNVCSIHTALLTSYVAINLHSICINQKYNPHKKTPIFQCCPQPI